jgi:hypothetical protein
MDSIDSLVAIEVQPQSARSRSRSRSDSDTSTTISEDDDDDDNDDNDDDDDDHNDDDAENSVYISDGLTISTSSGLAGSTRTSIASGGTAVVVPQSGGSTGSGRLVTPMATTASPVIGSHSGPMPLSPVAPQFEPGASGAAARIATQYTESLRRRTENLTQKRLRLQVRLKMVKYRRSDML